MRIQGCTLFTNKSELLNAVSLYLISEEFGQNRTKKGSDALRLIFVPEICEGGLIHFHIVRVLSNIPVPFLFVHLLNIYETVLV